MDRHWRQMWGIARYELRIQWRRGMLRMVMFILPLASVLVIFLLAGMQAQLSASRTQWSAAYPAEFRLTAMAIFILLPAAAPIFAALPLLVAETIPLDSKLNMRDTLDCLPLPLWTYLAGKVLGVWLGVLIALAVCIPVVGAVFYWKLGAFNLWIWLQVWGAVVVPSGLLSSGLGVLFAAAQLTRRRAILVNFLLIPVFVYLYSVSPLLHVTIIASLAPEQAFDLDANGKITALRLMSGDVMALSVGLMVVALVAAGLLAWGGMRWKAGRA